MTPDPWTLHTRALSKIELKEDKKRKNMVDLQELIKKPLAGTPVPPKPKSKFKTATSS